MKIPILISSLLILSVTTFSQTNYVKLISCSQEEIPICLKQIGNSYFASIRTCYEKLGLWQGTNFLKLNSFGEITAELNYEISDDHFFSIENILYLNNADFLAIGRYKSETEENANIEIMRLDTNLNLIWEKRYAVNSPLIGNITSILGENGNIIIGTACVTMLPDWQRMLLFMEVSSDGDSIQSKYEVNGNPYSTSIYSLIALNGQYKAFVYGYSSYVPNQGFSEILQLDAGFNLLGVNPAPYIIEGYTTACKIDEFRYYLSGMAYSSPTHYDVGIAKLSSSEDSIAYNHAGKPGITVDYSGWKKCMTIANSNSIYTGGTGFDNGDFYNCNYINKVLMLSNYDSLLNCRWTRFYGNDTAYYTMSTLDATSDGGCIMGGMIYTPTRPENLLDAVIIKVDSLGFFTGLPENIFLQMHEAIVYPNPGQNIVTIQIGPQICGAFFRMYNINGTIVTETILEKSTEQINISNLPPGTYPWQIIYKGKITEYGKWIRQ